MYTNYYIGLKLKLVFLEITNLYYFKLNKK